MIIWINGAFGAGKSTLAEEPRRRLPDALVLRADRYSFAEPADLVPADLGLDGDEAGRDAGVQPVGRAPAGSLATTRTRPAASW